MNKRERGWGEHELGSNVVDGFKVSVHVRRMWAIIVDVLLAK